jgi:hypothetical protein
MNEEKKSNDAKKKLEMDWMKYKKTKGRKKNND